MIEIIGKIDSEVIPKRCADIFGNLIMFFKTNKKFLLKFLEMKEKNTYYWTTILPYKLDENKPCIIGFATDITILKNQK